VLPSEALVAAMASGAASALGELYDRHHRDVFGFLCAAANVHGPDLDDLVQETFLSAYASARTFQGRSAVKTWLFGIGLNLARNHARAEGRRRRATERIPAAERTAARPDAQIDANRQLSRLAEAIAALPPDLRAAYVTCVIEGVAGAEAARVLGARKGTLWRWVHEAREQLRRKIGRSDS
jgi:RNA polymerase sigma-70 factor, ECF subfamily